MAVFCRWVLILSLLLAAGPRLVAATPTETGAFNSAVQSFHDTFYRLAETNFANFSRQFPNSKFLPEALLYEARARFEQTNYAGAIELLRARQDQAGGLTDKYLLLLGQSYFSSGDYPTAGEAFARLARQCPASTLLLEAAINEATCRAWVADWPGVIQLLQQPDGAFQGACHTQATNDLVLQGYLLLGKAQFSRQDYRAAEATLQPLAKLSLPQKAAWPFHDLLCRLRVAQGRLDEAVWNTTNLLAQAASPVQRADAFGFQAGLLERLGRGVEALAAYTNNLAEGTPSDRQRQAVWKITGLYLARNLTAEPIQLFEKYAASYPAGPATDPALLMLGELRLRLASLEPNPTLLLATNTPAGTNLRQAQEALTLLTKNFPQSDLAGRAQLDLGWCWWLQQNWPQCQAACQAALERLPISIDQATARFKLADAQFQQTNYAGAIANYRAIVENDKLAALPEVRTNLLESALYQIVRAGLAGDKLADVTNALSRILSWYPTGFHTDRALLLAGQEICRRSDPANARQMFEDFVKKAPDAPLAPQVRLAIARTYEQTGQWPEAIREYNSWVERYTNNDARPTAEYCRAQANFHAGEETNAFGIFTNLIAHFASNDCTPLAQWWVGDYYYRNGNPLEAERNYKLIFQTTNPPPGELAYQARMMAGRCAVDRQAWADAINDFTNLTGDANCPADLRAQAMFAYGDTLMMKSEDSQRATNKFEGYTEAIAVFSEICKQFPTTNPVVPLALGEKAICLMQWAKISGQDDQLTNALQGFRQTADSPHADFTVRSIARIGMAVVLEKQAEQKTGADRTNLLNQALEIYLNKVLYYKNELPEGAQPDWFWVEYAGMEAVRLLTETDALRDPERAIKVCERLKGWLPPLSAKLERTILKVREKADRLKK